jgi:HD-like signal output (HDOD) protein
MKAFSSWRREARTLPGGDPAPGRAAGFDGLSERDFSALYKLSPARTLDGGEELTPPAGDAPLMYVITGGSVELRAPSPEDMLAPAVLTKGSCLELRPAGAGGGAAYRVTARERTTLLQLNATLLAHLSPETRAFVTTGVATTLAKVTAALATCCANLGRAKTELTRCLLELHEQRKAVSRAEVVAWAVESIPELPVHATSLMSKLLAPNARSDEIVELIKSDPPLAGLVLKTVNSPYFGLQTKISDYYRAFLFLGTSNVYRLILDDGLRKVLPECPEAEEIQAHSYLVSVFAQEVAIAARLQPSVCTTVGLLHDIGQTVGLLLRTRQPEVASFVQLLDAPQLGADLLRRWAVPEEVCAVIEHQHEPEFLPPDSIDGAYRREVATLYLAHVCAELTVSGEPVSTSTAYVLQYLALLGVQEATLVDFYHRRIVPKIAKQAERLPGRVRGLLHLEESGGGAAAG